MSSPFAHIVSLERELIARVMAPEDRLTLCREVLAAAQTLPFAIGVFRGVRSLFAADNESSDASPQERELGAQVAGRIMSEADQDQSCLLTSSPPSIRSMLYVWSAFGDRDALHQHVEKLLEMEPAFVVQLLKAYSPTITSGGGKRRYGSFGSEQYDTLVAQLDAELIVQALRQHFADQVTPTDEYPDHTEKDPDLETAIQFLWLHNHNAE